MSKGSNRRKEDTEKVRNNWDVIFGSKKPQDPKPKETGKENAK